MAANASDNGGQSNLVSVTEAAARLGKSERTLRRWIASGKIETVDIGGKAYIQLAGAGTPADTSGTNDQMAAQSAVNDRHLSDPLEAALRDTIRRLEDENARLWTMLQSMLPAPKSTGESTGSRTQWAAPAWVWILLVAAILAAGGYALWLMK